MNKEVRGGNLNEPEKSPVRAWAEFAHHLGQGVTLSTNTFYMFYLSLTFFHFMHVIMGMVILSAVAWFTLKVWASHRLA